MRFKIISIVILAFMLFGMTAYAEDSLSAVVGYESQTDGSIRVTVSGKAPDAYRVLMTAVAPGTEDWSSADWSALENDVLREAYLVGTDLVTLNGSEEEFVFSFFIAAADPAGEYMIKLDTEAQTKLLGYYKPTEDEKTSCADEFQNAAAAEVAGLIDKYQNDIPRLYLSYYDELAAADKELLGNCFLIVRQGKYNNRLIFSDVHPCIDAAWLLHELQTQESAENIKPTLEECLNAVSEDYGSLYASLTGQFGFDPAPVFLTAKSGMNFSNAKWEEYISFIAKVLTVSAVKNGDIDFIVSSLKTMAEELGIDDVLSEAAAAGIALEAIANRLRSENFNTAEQINAIGDTIKNIVDDYSTPEDGDKPSKPGSSGNSGKGSGTGGNSYITAPPDPQETTDIPNQPSYTSAYFTDLGQYEWAAPAVDALYENRIISGVGQSEYAPQLSVKREEFAKMMVNVLNLPTKEEPEKFTDCTVSDWYFPYVMAGVSSGLIHGVSDTMFGSGQNITRQDAAVLCLRALESKDMVGNNVEKAAFTDMEAVSEYAAKAVGTLTSLGVITGYDDSSFRPMNHITRAEAAVIIYRVYQIIEEAGVNTK